MEEQLAFETDKVLSLTSQLENDESKKELAATVEQNVLLVKEIGEVRNELQKKVHVWIIRVYMVLYCDRKPYPSLAYILPSIVPYILLFRYSSTVHNYYIHIIVVLVGQIWPLLFMDVVCLLSQTLV